MDKKIKKYGTGEVKEEPCGFKLETEIDIDTGSLFLIVVSRYGTYIYLLAVSTEGDCSIFPYK